MEDYNKMSYCLLLLSERTKVKIRLVSFFHRHWNHLDEAKQSDTRSTKT